MWHVLSSNVKGFVNIQVMFPTLHTTNMTVLKQIRGIHLTQYIFLCPIRHTQISQTSIKDDAYRRRKTAYEIFLPKINSRNY